MMYDPKRINKFVFIVVILSHTKFIAKQKKMKNLLKFAALLFLIIGIGSCKKNNTGGDATIVAHIAHHEAPIYGATVYVKFKAKETPSNPESNYDLKIVGSATEDHVHIEGLRPGDYYLYAVGYDPSILQTVKGGLFVKIKYKERKKEIESHLHVTE